MKASELAKILSEHPDWEVVLDGVEFGPCNNDFSSGETKEFDEDCLLMKIDENKFVIEGYWDI